MDGGCSSAQGDVEKHINLAILLQLRELLEMSGCEVLVTRDTDTSIHDSGIEGIANQKRSDMDNRLALFNSCDDAICISIHQNQFTDPKYSGAQMFYSPTEGSQALAEAMQQTLCTFVDPANNRQAAQIPKTVYFMNHISCPAVLVECGFLTNPTEEARLRTPDYQLKLAAAMAGCWLQRSGLT